MFVVSLSSLFHKSIENNFHYFYVCPLFIRHRIQPFNSLRKFQDVLNLDILLKGSPILTVEENTDIFDAVHHFLIGKYKLGRGGRGKGDLNN
jgi:hypothetical protein